MNQPVVTLLPKCDKPKRDSLIKKYLSHKKENETFKFIQIGANDGITGDILRKDILSNPSWEGVIVEPLPHRFKSLVGNYKHRQGLKFENSAISQESGIFPFYVDRKDTGSSLSNKCNHVIYKQAIIKEIKVNCMTWSQLLKKHEYKLVDLVHIDAEGWDCKIVNDILNEKSPPVFIEFEVNFITDREEVKNTFSNLEKNGYSLFHIKWPWANYDCFAVDLNRIEKS